MRPRIGVSHTIRAAERAALRPAAGRRRGELARIVGDDAEVLALFRPASSI
jgi:hypothetical protein